MNIPKYFTLTCVFLIAFNLNGQSNLIWIGENLNEIIFDSGKWKYQNENWAHQIKEIDFKYYVANEITGKIRHEIDFEELDINVDTIRLTKGLTTQLFVKPHLLENNNFKFHSFEFAILGESGPIQTKYHLNKFGLYRKSNFKNETLIEKKVTDEQIHEFQNLIQKLDIKNMDKAYGRRNNCDDRENSFTFWDWNGKSYNYTAIDVRKQLLPIKEFILKIEN